MIVASGFEELEAKPSKPRRSRPWQTVVVLVLVLAPVLGVCISVIGRHWHAGGDQALEMLRIEDVGTSHTPLLGAWSRWGWAHPGPALFWALSPFYRMFGETGVPIGMGVLNGAAIAGVVLVAHRRGGSELAALAGLMLACLVRALGISLLVDIWNPWAAFLPFVLFVMLAWAVLCRDWVALPIAVFVGSSVVQIHAGYLPLVAPLLALAGAYAVVDVVRRQRAASESVRDPGKRWLITSGAVAIAVWMPALVQQVASSNGNLAALLQYVRDPKQATAGWTFAYGTLGAEMRPLGAWVTGNDNDGIGFTAVSGVWPAAVLIALIVCTGVLAWWRGQRDAAQLSIVVVVAVVSAVIATSKLTGGAFPYVTRWWWAVAAVANLALVWALLSVFGSPRLDSVVTALALLGIVVAGVMSVGDLPASFAQSDMIEAVSRLNGPTADALDRQTRYLVQPFDTSQLGFVSNGLLVALRRQGFQLFVPPDSISDIAYGSWRVATPDRVDALLSVVDIAEPRWKPPLNSRLVASYDPLSPTERARSTELEAKIRNRMGPHPPPRVFVDTKYRKALAQGTGVSAAEVDELMALQNRGDGFSVYLSPAP